ncbi:MAG TPA: hypothetical protein VFE51_16370 [Verrucomicrobiae bacterium]|nr:hypothetical protein [Verrucomicrobiae bacterium]
MKELLTRRDEWVKKFNDQVKARHDIVNIYTEQVHQVERNQTVRTK